MCDNFSDVAESFPELIRPGVLYRSADPRFSDLTSIGNPRTIINLRMEPDNQVFQGCTYIHCPIANKIEKYDTTQEEVRKWLAVTFQQIALAEVPILLHCRAGKDRTGIVVAILLKILFEHQSY
ncbi:protein-tyrosine phosphatase-like protein [Obelidium mucronatum]|nr:protein-tyrosine phosphatase-like protein [Obelidium mucronatum]